MSRLTLLLAAASIALSAQAHATGPGTEKAATLLSSEDLDPAAVLPGPPTPDSLQSRAEITELRSTQAERTEADFAAAKRDNLTKDATIFAGVLGPGFDLARLPHTQTLMAVVRATEKDVANRAKDEFKRPRPWIVEPELKTCTRDDEPLTSYPSGHTTMGYAMAAVLARLVPSKAPAIMARAAVYGQNRIVCIEHFRSDVTAGEALGLIVAERLMAKPQFQAIFIAAQAELTAAGVR